MYIARKLRSFGVVGRNKNVLNLSQNGGNMGKNILETLPKYILELLLHKKKNKRKNSLLKHLRNTYRKIHTNPNLQYTINNLRSQLYQIELEEEQGAKFAQRFSMSCKAKNAPNSFSLKWKNEKMHKKLCFL